MATITTFIADTILYGGNEVDEIGNNTSQFVLWVNMALVNRHEEVCALSNKWTTDTITFSAKGFEKAVPTDWDYLSDVELYTDSDHQNHYDSWKVSYGVHRFNSEVAASTSFYRRYRQAPTTYTAEGNTFAEIANPRIKKIMIEEVIALFLSAVNDLESSPAEVNALTKANQNS